MSSEFYINVNNVSLVYDLYYDKTNTLKEYFANLFKKRDYLQKKKDKLYALKNVNLTIHNGERVGVIGLNGAGKSTFLKVLSGLLKPTTGNLDINGTVQPLIEIGAGFNPEFSGRENIYLNGAMLGFTKRQIAEKENEIVMFSELDNFIDVPVKYYSSGMIVRLAFSIATVISPEILLLDEMLSAGDISFIAKAKKRMENILNVAKIMVLVSHDLSLIESLTMRTLVFVNGEIHFDGNTNDAIDFYRNYVEQQLAEREHDEELKRESALLAQRKSELKLSEAERAKLEEERRLEEERIRIEEEKRKEEERINNPITINDVRHKNVSRDQFEIFPDDEVEFLIDFEIKETFNEFFVNLVINDGTGGSIAHFRNDFSDFDLKDLNPGIYNVKIDMKRIPFKSGKYKYYVRLVGKKENGALVIQDSNEISCRISGEKKQPDLIKHVWEINKSGIINE